MSKNSVTKEQNEKHKKILDGLLKLPENRYCVDCLSRGPRWASVNLGVFLCIQCSGIHRSLGVHISQVRSATLDTWLPEQVAFMQRMGNQKANEYWEADLPSNFKRPSEDNRSAVETFIRSKYERKLYAMRNVSPPRLDKPDRPRSAANTRDNGYNSDGGVRYSDDPQSPKGTPTRFGAPPTRGEQNSSPLPRPAAPSTPPRLVSQMPTPQARPTSPSAQPPHKVESAPALFDLLSINDSSVQTKVAPASPPAAAPAAWAAFPEPGVPSQPTPAAPAPAAQQSAPHPAPPAPQAAGTMAALTDLFTASNPDKPQLPSQTPPVSGGAPATAAAQHHAIPKKNTSDIMSLFDQGPSPALLQQQMLFMQQQQALYMQAAAAAAGQAGTGAPPAGMPNMFAAQPPLVGLGMGGAEAVQAPGGFPGMPAGFPGMMAMPNGQMQMPGAGMFASPMPVFNQPYMQGPTGGQMPPSMAPSSTHGNPAAALGPTATNSPASAPGAHYDFSALLQPAK